MSLLWSITDDSLPYKQVPWESNIPLALGCHINAAPHAVYNLTYNENDMTSQLRLRVESKQGRH